MTRVGKHRGWKRTLMWGVKEKQPHPGQAMTQWETIQLWWNIPLYSCKHNFAFSEGKKKTTPHHNHPELTQSRNTDSYCYSQWLKESQLQNNWFNSEKIKESVVVCSPSRFHTFLHKQEHSSSHKTIRIVIGRKIFRLKMAMPQRNSAGTNPPSYSSRDFGDIL